MQASRGFPEILASRVTRILLSESLRPCTCMPGRAYSRTSSRASFGQRNTRRRRTLLPSPILQSSGCLSTVQSRQGHTAPTEGSPFREKGRGEETPIRGQWQRPAYCDSAKSPHLFFSCTNSCTSSDGLLYTSKRRTFFAANLCLSQLSTGLRV